MELVTGSPELVLIMALAKEDEAEFENNSDTASVGSSSATASHNDSVENDEEVEDDNGPSSEHECTSSQLEWSCGSRSDFTVIAHQRDVWGESDYNGAEVGAILLDDPLSAAPPSSESISNVSDNNEYDDGTISSESSNGSEQSTMSTIQ